MAVAPIDASRVTGGIGSNTNNATDTSNVVFATYSKTNGTEFRVFVVVVAGVVVSGDGADVCCDIGVGWCKL